MPIETKILDGVGSDFHAKVTNRNSLKVSIDEPELLEQGSPNKRRFYKQTLSGMNVDGSVTPQEFTISSPTSPTSDEHDIYVTRIIWVISDGTQSFNKWGAITALTNGCDLYVKEQGTTTYLIDSAKTGGDLLVQSGMFDAFGSGTSTSIISGWATNDDALVAIFDIDKIISGGIRLGRGSRDKIVAVVNDNLTALSDQFVQVFGYKLYN